MGKIKPYVKTDWVPGLTPVTRENMTNIEEQVESITNVLVEASSTDKSAGAIVVRNSEGKVEGDIAGNSGTTTKFDKKKLLKVTGVVNGQVQFDGSEEGDKIEIATTLDKGYQQLLDQKLECFLNTKHMQGCPTLGLGQYCYVINDIVVDGSRLYEVIDYAGEVKLDNGLWARLVPRKTITGDLSDLMFALTEKILEGLNQLEGVVLAIKTEKNSALTAINSDKVTALNDIALARGTALGTLEQYMHAAENGGNANSVQGYVPRNFKRTEDTIADLVSSASNKYRIGDVVELNGYYTAGDGAGHKRKIEATDDGSGVQLANGLWGNVVHNGEVNVSWFGANENEDVSDVLNKVIHCKNTHIIHIDTKYVLNSSILMKSNLILDCNNNTIKTIEGAQFKILDVENVVVRNAKFVTTEIIDQTNAIHVNFRCSRSKNLFFENLTFIDCSAYGSHNFDMGDCHYVKIYDCVFLGRTPTDAYYQNKTSNEYIQFDSNTPFGQPGEQDDKYTFKACTYVDVYRCRFGDSEKNAGRTAVGQHGVVASGTDFKPGDFITVRDCTFTYSTKPVSQNPNHEVNTITVFQNCGNNMVIRDNIIKIGKYYDCVLFKAFKNNEYFDCVVFENNKIDAELGGGKRYEEFFIKLDNWGKVIIKNNIINITKEDTEKYLAMFQTGEYARGLEIIIENNTINVKNISFLRSNNESSKVIFRNNAMKHDSQNNPFLVNKYAYFKLEKNIINVVGTTAVFLQSSKYDGVADGDLFINDNIFNLAPNVNEFVIAINKKISLYNNIVKGEGVMNLSTGHDKASPLINNVINEKIFENPVPLLSRHILNGETISLTQPITNFRKILLTFGDIDNDIAFFEQSTSILRTSRYYQVIGMDTFISGVLSENGSSEVAVFKFLDNSTLEYTASYIDGKLLTSGSANFRLRDIHGFF